MKSIILFVFGLVLISLNVRAAPSGGHLTLCYVEVGHWC